MEKIKYRGWHTKLNKMFSAEEMGEDQLTLMTDGRGFVNVSGSSTRLSQFLGDQMIPMQFTGLLDKNGKEIYEGDILKHWFSPGRTEKIICEVDNIIALISKLRNYRNIYDLNDRFEIIGNIYENPDLLK